jgi:hypothetical protein
MAMSDGVTARPESAGLRGGTPTWVAVLYTVALLLVFLGERVLSTVAWLRWSLTGLGVLIVVALTGLRWVAVRVTAGERRSVERALAILSTCGMLALFLYLTTTEPFDAQVGLTKMALETRHRYEAVATVTWIVLVIGSLIPMLFAERALFPMRRAERIEWRRVRDAMLSGLTLGLAVVYATLFTFAAGELDVKADFSYFHTAEPSESTRKIAASGNVPIRMVAFFPDLNEVGAEVGAYMRELSDGAPNVQVEMRDRLLVPQLAKDMKANEDGVIVFGYGPQRESLAIGTDIQTVRPKLKTLDADVQKTLLKLMREKRTAYFTVGHGELNDSQPTPENEGRTGKSIRQLVEQQNYVLKDLSAATGLGVDVPDDATVVLVLGPKQLFLPEEVGALKRYADRGGKLFLCLDPDAKIDLSPLADIVGLTVSRSLLANDKVHLRRRFNDSDHLILATNRYSSHASISTLSRMSSHPVFFLGAGALDKKTGADTQLKIDFAVRALPDTFDDENGSFRFDAAADKRQPYPLVAAVSKPVNTGDPKKKNDEMRAFVLGDADAVSDAAFGSNEGNVVLAADAVRWLGGEESFAGAVTTTEDVRIEHTKQKDLVWFYGSIFGAPAIVLGGGLFYAHRVRRPKKKPQPKALPQREPGQGGDISPKSESRA